MENIDPVTLGASPLLFWNYLIWRKPTRAYFGLKDAQQFLVLDKMVQDLNIPVQMIGVPTVREESGLALSSRNVYLSDEARNKVAPLIYQTLVHSKKELLKGMSPHSVIEEAQISLKNAGFEVQYYELRSLPGIGKRYGSKYLYIFFTQYISRHAEQLPSCRCCISTI